jgi:tetratricopeptide (TPR) repeat protein
MSVVVIVGASLGGFALARHESQRADENARLRDEARDAQREAERRFQQTSETVDSYLTDVAESTLLDGPALEPLRMQLFEKARGYYATFVHERDNDPKVRAEYALGLFRLAKITADIKDQSKAIELFQQALGILWP